jgi:tellurite resistance protein TerC
MNPFALILLSLFGVGAVLLDLGVFNRKQRVLPLPTALLWSTFWFAIALLFTGSVYGIHELELGETVGLASSGLQGQPAALQLFGGYLIEKAIALANIMVIALIFEHFAIPLRRQARTLFIALMAMVLFRIIALAAGWGIRAAFPWTLYVFGGLLLASAARVFVARSASIAPRRNLIVFLLRRRYPPAEKKIDEQPDSGEAFLRGKAGERRVTPLLEALVLALTANAMFAVGAVPGIFAVTHDPFIVVTANLFALLGLRSMYFVVAGFIGRLRYLKLSLAVLLGYVAVKMLLAERHPLSALSSLAVVGAILTSGFLLSMILGPREAPGLSPMLRGLEELVWISYRQGRRLVIFLLGSTVMLIGVVMIVTPGPAFVMIPLGLAILTIEFAWARRWMAHLRQGFRQVETKISDRVRRSRADRETDRSPLKGPAGEDNP